MKHKTLDQLACPQCHASLELIAVEHTLQECHTGNLYCKKCSRNFSIIDGIPHFTSPEQLTGFNRRFSRLYDWFSGIYAAFSKVAFAYIGMDEETGQREITDRLDPRGGRVLEVSIGPGVNLPYLVRRPDVGEVFGLDISLGQLRRCQRYVGRKGWDVDLFLGNGEQLPFQDESFEGVFHVGGINFFNNKEAAIHEMIRVAKPGARILIADETEKGAQGYEKFIPGFKRSFGGKRTEIIAPIDLVPDDMLEKKVFDVWKGWLYCIEFVKPQGGEAE
ncbi:MAG: methyltransferase domain-containing protein [Anaerolineales bacterium]